MLDFSRINDPEYFNNEIENIRNITEIRELEDILKLLSVKIENDAIDPTSARMIVSAVNEQRLVLENEQKMVRQSNSKKGNAKRLTLSPTSVSSRAGAVSMVFLVVNLAIIAAMYTLLIVSKITK